MSMNEKSRHDKLQAKKARRIKRLNKIALKKKFMVEKPSRRVDFNRGAWNNTMPAKVSYKVLNRKKIGFDKQAWQDGGT